MLMSGLGSDKLHVKYIGEATEKGPAFPRYYTLTHSDVTGELFLSIGTDYDKTSISGWYTRLMRDEVLAKYQEGEGGVELHVFCHVSGGLVVGTAGWRYRIFKYHLPDVLQAFRYGDDVFIRANPSFAKAPIRVHFKSKRRRYHKVEDLGILDDYLIKT